MRYVEKYDRGTQTTDYYIIRRMHIAFWINKPTDMHSEYKILTAFRLQR
jgi:hypothetical protein